jgi:hypothetical protein
MKRRYYGDSPVLMEIWILEERCQSGVTEYVM